jgi:membrane-associated phospholipid phosphatase
MDIDHWLFYTINQSLSNPLFDWLMPFLREKLFWVPFYVFLYFWARACFSRNQFTLFLVGILLTVTLTDMVSSRVIKPLASRERPCNLEHIEKQVLERVPCGSGYSFPSSHAANHFGLAFFLMAALTTISRRARIMLVLWAASIALAQVYVGVHFPSDVCFGAVLGATIGTGIGIHIAAKIVKL